MQLRCLRFVEVYSKGKAYGNASVDTREEKLMCDVFPDLCPVPEPRHLRDPDTEPAAGGEGAGQLPGPPTLPPPRPGNTAGGEAQLLGVHRCECVCNI